MLVVRNKSTSVLFPMPDPREEKLGNLEMSREALIISRVKVSL